MRENRKTDASSPPGWHPLRLASSISDQIIPRAARGGFIPRVQGKTESPPAARRELKPDYYTKKRGGSRREIRGECLRQLRLRPPCRCRTGNPAAAGGCPAKGGLGCRGRDATSRALRTYK